MLKIVWQFFKMLNVELPRSSSDVRSSLGATAEMGQTL